MLLRWCFVSLFLIMASPVKATEQFLLKFELTQEDGMLQKGRLIVSKKPRTWSRGLERSYLKLRCIQQESGKTKKQFSTMEHFSGLRVTHGQVGHYIELTVVWDVVQARLMEIRALPQQECKDLAPVVSTTEETFTFPAKTGLDESLSFGENMVFRVRLQSLGGEALTGTSDTDAP